MTVWTEVTQGLDYGGYAAWEALAESSDRSHVPLFLRLTLPEGADMSLAQAISATLAQPEALFSRHERDLLVTELALAGAAGWPHEVRTVAIWPRDKLSALPAYWQVLDVGPGQALAAGSPAIMDGQDLRQTTGDLDPKIPVLALIDDGIGFLNARFRRNRDATRFLSVWMQTPERRPGPAAEPATGVVCGQILSQAQINAFIADGDAEDAVYRRVNRELLQRSERGMTLQRVAHGTHVLDLAAGVAPWAGDILASVPLLAVQLPAAALRETAGRRMEAYLVQGLRWILAETLRQANQTDVPPLVINLSIGSLAGPGDETAFLADWLRHEIVRHARMTGGSELRLVVAYGNSRRSRLVARAELRRTKPMTLGWRVLPDDFSASFLELRVDAGMTDGVNLRLIPPGGSGLPSLDLPWPAAGTGQRLDAGGPIAAVTGVLEPGGQALCHIALAPTAGPDGLGPPGTWQVQVRTEIAEPLRLTARVQRDDTPPGYRTLGRQSWLDHPMAWEWDPEKRDYSAPRGPSDAPGCPVTREGSAVAYAGAAHPSILFVGAVRPRADAPLGVRPMPYSAEGARYLLRAGESQGPSLVARGDDGTALPGRAAAGVLSGSVARISGSSMAAPAVARALLRYFLAVPASSRTPEAERQALTGTPDWHSPDARLGHGVLVSTG